jgi:uncharacterized membrane protein YgdD (TMEM256/DUF423 family)
MQKIILIIGAILGALSVMIGAFGAHGLKNMLKATNRLDIFETAVKYQFYHTLAILAVGVLLFHLQSRWLTYSAYSFTMGIFIFSGSLYILCLTNVSGWGAVTPIGGLLLIAGWIFLLIALINS